MSQWRDETQTSDTVPNNPGPAAKQTGTCGPTLPGPSCHSFTYMHGWVSANYSIRPTTSLSHCMCCNKQMTAQHFDMSRKVGQSELHIEINKLKCMGVVTIGAWLPIFEFEVETFQQFSVGKWRSFYLNWFTTVVTTKRLSIIPEFMCACSGVMCTAFVRYLSIRYANLGNWLLSK